MIAARCWLQSTGGLCRTLVKKGISGQGVLRAMPAVDRVELPDQAGVGGGRFERSDGDGGPPSLPSLASLSRLPLQASPSARREARLRSLQAAAAAAAVVLHSVYHFNRGELGVCVCVYTYGVACCA